MKKSILKISSLFMAVILLFSTLSFTVQKHICAGEVADIALFGNLESCNMHDAKKDINLSSFEKESCCHDNSQFIKGSNAELKSSKASQGDFTVLTAVFLYTYFNSYEPLEKNLTDFKNYSPPIVIKDIPVLYESFLI
ncbi:hypothetical protein JBL43_03880 [Aureibaculum sp. A20]|uniref:Secreted protein n=1 Tax=Aureibaculum flavum TaxID=2795986 RepID=A0ABS0WN07_9FLAO|nr:hypothetical protein [Aureibaculum flavum]MBJ2173360.1 hypothetical protein [Aureibaculum flavum]